MVDSVLKQKRSHNDSIRTPGLKMALIYESPLFLEYRQGSLDRPPIPNYVHAHCEQCGDRAEMVFYLPLNLQKVINMQLLHITPILY